MIPPLVVALALVLVFTALTAWWMDRASALTARAEHDAVSVQWESLVLARQDLRLAVDERGQPTLHGRASGVPFTLGFLSRDDAMNGLLGVTAATELSLGDLVIFRGTEPLSSVPSTSVVFSTGDADFDSVFTARATNAERARLCLDDTVRGALLAIPGGGVYLRDNVLVLVSELSAAAVDSAMIDSVVTVVTALCARGE